MLTRKWHNLTVNDLLHTPSGRIELLNALLGLSWGIVLLNPFAQSFGSGNFGAMELLSEELVGLIFLSVGLFGFVTAIFGSVRLRLVASELFAILWAVLFTLFASRDFFAHPQSLIYLSLFGVTFSVSARLRTLKRNMKKLNAE